MLISGVCWVNASHNFPSMNIDFSVPNILQKIENVEENVILKIMEIAANNPFCLGCVVAGHVQATAA